jgi:hypothetical protein
MASPSALKALLEALQAEQERRQAANLRAADDSRAWLLQTLTVMGESLRASPDFIEPTAAEQEQAMAELDRWFAAHGYDPAE